MEQQKILRLIYNMLLQLLLLPLVMAAALLAVVWIIMMEVVVSKFLSREKNEKRNWKLTYWYE